MKHLSILILKEDEWWVAQCLEYDIAAQAESKEKAEYEFFRVLCGRISMAEELGVGPFDGIPAAPRYYHQLAFTRRIGHREFTQPASCPMTIPSDINLDFVYGKTL